MTGRSDCAGKERCRSSLPGLMSGFGFLWRRLNGVVEVVVVVVEQAERRRNLDRRSLKLFLGFSM